MLRKVGLLLFFCKLFCLVSFFYWLAFFRYRVQNKRVVVKEQVANDIKADYIVKLQVGVWS